MNARHPVMRIVLVVDERFGAEAIRHWDNIGNLPAGEHFLYAAPSGWQPISTAPKDGTLVLLSVCWSGIGEAHRARIDPVMCVARFDGAFWIDDEGVFQAAEADATHWMPLPEPPK
jgi:hypothetical protein